VDALRRLNDETDSCSHASELVCFEEITPFASPKKQGEKSAKAASSPAPSINLRIEQLSADAEVELSDKRIDVVNKTILRALKRYL
jgi:hypothetical protein